MAATSVSTSAQEGAMQAAPRPWWVTLILGISALVVGATMLWGTTSTKVDLYQMLVALLGLWWLIRGILDIVSMFVDHRAWGWKLFMGIVGIVAGGYILMYPIAAGIALPQIFVLVLGIWALMDGALLLVMAFRGGGWGAGILGGLAILLGFVLIGDYGHLGSGLAMVWSGAILGVIGGIALIVQGFMARKA